MGNFLTAETEGQNFPVKVDVNFSKGQKLPAPDMRTSPSSERSRIR